MLSRCSPRSKDSPRSKGAIRVTEQREAGNFSYSKDMSREIGGLSVKHRIGSREPFFGDAHDIEIDCCCCCDCFSHARNSHCAGADRRTTQHAGRSQGQGRKTSGQIGIDAAIAPAGAVLHVGLDHDRRVSAVEVEMSLDFFESLSSLRLDCRRQSSVRRSHPSRPRRAIRMERRI